MTENLASDENLQQIPALIQSALVAERLSQESATNLKRWLYEPQFAEYQTSLQQMVLTDQFDELHRLFWEVIPFGTGGRRGVMGELGSATINSRTIAESAHGLAIYCRGIIGAEGGKAVVACDTRNRSDQFSRLAATTLAAHGFQVFFFESHRSTPELSFAVRRLNCDVGVMISASHNPPSDNGFKAYWSHGGQILSPHDAGIISEVVNAGVIPEIDFDAAVTAGKIVPMGEDDSRGIDAAYIAAVTELSCSSARDVSALFSPLHGVGETSVFAVLEAAGFSGVEIFEPHREPNGDFPNVDGQLPNPERTAVFRPLIDHAKTADRKTTEAKTAGANLLLASDPDADRLGVVVRNADGDYVPISGNQTGALITDYLLRKRAENGTLSADNYVVETLVTTPLIAAIARQYGVRIIDDLLVGFKYIGQTIDAEGPDNFVFGAEESLGFLAGSYARDKDAAVAALFLLELAAELKRDGKTLLDALEALWLQHGYFTEGQTSKICEGPDGREQIENLMQTFRDAPPTMLCGIPLAAVRDYHDHEIRSLPDNVGVDELPSPAGDLLFFDSVEVGRRYSIAVRPSGTEPKIKFYFFVQSDVGDSLTNCRQQADQLMTDLQTALTQWIDAELDDR